MTEAALITTEPQLITSKPSRVLLYEDRAEVTRRATLDALEPGVHWVICRGVTLFVDDRSVQASIATGNARVLSARVLRKVESEPSLDRAELETLEARERAASLELADAKTRLLRLDAQAASNRGFFDQWREALAQIPRTDGSPIERWKEAQELVHTKLHELGQEQLEKMRARADAELALVNTRARLEQGRALTTRVEAFIEVQLELTEPGPVELELVYRTPCAQWRPEHLARLTHVEGQSRVEIVTYATAWQRTGERWDDVELSFSTARPAQASNAPTIEDDVLYSRRKSKDERKNIVVEARDQTIETGRSSGAAVEEMPGVDDGGEPLVLEARELATLASNGQPLRVEVHRVTLDAEVDCVLMPEQSAVAHVRARCIWKAAMPLLAGPARMARGPSFMGRSRLDFVASGEPLVIGFGPESALRVKRVVRTQRDRTAVTGKQHVERSVTLYISNLSGETKSVKVTERVPISELSEVTVELDEHPDWTLDSKDGFLERLLTVDPRAHLTLELKHTIHAKSQVRLPF